MPDIDLSDDEHAAVTAAVRRTIDEDPFPHSPRLAALRAALAKLESLLIDRHCQRHQPVPVVVVGRDVGRPDR